MTRFKKESLWLVVLLSSVLLAFGASNTACAVAKEAPLTVYTLDIGQGDSTLIITPAKKTILIDGGKGGSGYKKKDKAKTVIIPLLKKLGIKKLDMVIMTHPDFDHIGGLVYLLENTKKDSAYPIEIKEFLDPGHPGTTYLYKELLQAVKDRPEIKYRIVKNGEMLDFGKGVTAQIVAPNHIFKNPNDSSIVIKLTCGDVSFLLTGDAALESEKFMISDYGDKLKSTVLHAGHHGSGHSSSTEFLDLVKPKAILVSVGEKNTHLLPDKEALKRLEATGAKIYRTDYQGMITVTTDGKSYEIITEREAPPVEKRWDTVKVLSEDEKININTASAEELKTLPRIGKVLSERIIAARPFKSVDDLQRVNRIGPKIVARLRPLVTVGIPGAKPPEIKLAPGVSSIGSITLKDVGKKIATVEGNILSIKIFRYERGRTLAISDKTGTILVLIWKDLYERIPARDKLQKGVRVRVKGEIGEYKGKLQIKPSAPADIQIIADPAG